MRSLLNEYKMFFREARGSFGTVGAVAPSSRFLSRAIVSELSTRSDRVRVLEVGPGTGAITREIVRYLRPQDQFDIVELNAGFVAALENQFRHDEHFRRVAENTRILHMPVQDLETDHGYDFVISGLPLNSFPTELVQTIFQSYVRLLAPGGVLSFFEYLWVRDVRRLFVRKRERRRLVRVGSLIERYVDRYEFRRNTVLINFPPALVHHLRLNGQAADLTAGIPAHAATSVS